MTAYQKLKDAFTRLSHLNYINSIMMWDEAVMMPDGSGKARAEALATFNGIHQKLLSSKQHKKLIESAKQESLLPWDKANLSLMEKQYKRATCIPKRLTEKFIQET